MTAMDCLSPLSDPRAVTRRSGLGLVLWQDELGGPADDPAHLADQLA